MIFHELSKSMHDWSLVEIISDASDTTSFDVAKIVSLSKEFVCYLTIDTAGRYDEFHCTSVSSIVRLGRNEIYGGILSDMVKGEVSPVWPLSSSCSLDDVLGWLQSSSCAVHFEDDYGTTRGMLTGFDQEYLRVETYDSTCKYEGIEIIHRDAITAYRFGGRKQRVLDYVLQKMREC